MCVFVCVYVCVFVCVLCVCLCVCCVCVRVHMSECVHSHVCACLYLCGRKIFHCKIVCYNFTEPYSSDVSHTILITISYSANKVH